MTFTFWTLQAPIEPMAIFHIKNHFYGTTECILVRVNSQTKEGLPKYNHHGKNKWAEFAGDKPFPVLLCRQSFANAFKSSDQFGKSIIAFLGRLPYSSHHWVC